MSTIKVDDAKYAEVYKAYVDNGASVLANGFTGVGSSGEGAGFNAGEIISLPEQAQVIGIKIRGSERMAEAIIVKVTTPDGAERYQPFYPKSLSKRMSVLTVDAEGRVLDQKFDKPHGTAAAWYQQQSGRKVQDIVEDLIKLGKDIKVTDVKLIDTYRYGSTEVIKSNLYTYDFV